MKVLKALPLVTLAAATLKIFLSGKWKLAIKVRRGKVGLTIPL